MPTARLGYVPALDGLRGIAILLVIAFHYLGEPFGGAYGVDLFFVLSGFLITTLLLEEKAEAGRISLRGFYIRRARRLLPALYTMLACYLIYEAARGRDGFQPVFGYGFYVGNFYYLIRHQADGAGLDHLWSLAQEEQFYLVWPTVFLVVCGMRRRLVWISAAVLAIAAWRVVLTLHGAEMPRLYRSPDTHSDGLLLGALFAFIRWNGYTAPEWVAKVGLGLTVPPIIIGQWNWGLPMFEIGAVLLVAAAVSDTDFAKLVAWPPLVSVGVLSYSLYIWHYPMLWAVGGYSRVLAFVLSFAAAALSYRFVEQRFRHRQMAIPRPAPAAA